MSNPPTGSTKRPPAGSAAARNGVGVQPDPAYFELMARVGETHWWYRGRRAVLAGLLGTRLGAASVVVDVGCGTGEVLGQLRESGAGTAVGTDLSVDALVHARRRAPVLRSVAERLPFRDSAADALVSLEVIEHLDDDATALAEYLRVLRPGGTIVLSVPAYPWLWSDHDVRAAHRRRYRRAEFRAVAEAAGVRVERLTGYYSFLVPLAGLLRKTPLRRLVRGTDEEVSSAHPAVEVMFSGLARVERALVKRVDLPVGLSFVLIGTAPPG